jgi:hypothetical protein
MESFSEVLSGIFLFNMCEGFFFLLLKSVGILRWGY